MYLLTSASIKFSVLKIMLNFQYFRDRAIKTFPSRAISTVTVMSQVVIGTDLGDYSHFPLIFQDKGCNFLCGLVVRVSGYRSRVRFPTLPDFLRSSGSGTGCTQPREYKGDYT
jgi:hypothetical protein